MRKFFIAVGVFLVVLGNFLSSASASATYLVEPHVGAPYVAGVVKPEILANSLELVNQIRGIAGVPNDLTLGDDYVLKAQHGAVLLDRHGSLSHTPPKPTDMPQDFYGIGYEGTSKSNISFSWREENGVRYGNITINKSIMSCMDDSDAKNIDRLGHRRWLLSPQMKHIGFGISERGGYAATYIADFSREITFEYDFIAWPAKNSHPTKFFGGGQAWSVSLNDEKYDNQNLDGIKVKLKRQRDGKEWNFSKTSTNDGYFNIDTLGFGGIPFCIIFRPNGVGSYGHGDVFDVEIEGLQNLSGDAVSLSYSTQFYGGTTPDDPDDSGSGGCNSGVGISSMLLLLGLAGKFINKKF